MLFILDQLGSHGLSRSRYLMCLLELGALLLVGVTLSADDKILLKPKKVSQYLFIRIAPVEDM